MAPLLAWHPCPDPAPPYLSHGSPSHQQVQLGAHCTLAALKHSSHRCSTLAGPLKYQCGPSCLPAIPAQTWGPLLAGWATLEFASNATHILCAHSLWGRYRHSPSAAGTHHMGCDLCWAPHLPHFGPSPSSCFLSKALFPTHWLEAKDPTGSSSWHYRPEVSRHRWFDPRRWHPCVDPPSS